MSVHARNLMTGSGPKLTVALIPTCSGCSAVRLTDGLGQLQRWPNIREIHFDFDLKFEIHDCSGAINLPPPAVDNVMVDWISIVIKVTSDPRAAVVFGPVGGAVTGLARVHATSLPRTTRVARQDFCNKARACVGSCGESTLHSPGQPR